MWTKKLQFTQKIPPLLKNLISYWKLDDDMFNNTTTNFVDSFGSNDGICYNGEQASTKALIDGCAYLPTDNDLLIIDESSGDFDFKNGSDDMPFSGSSWHKITFINTSYGVKLFCKWKYFLGACTIDWRFGIGTNKKLYLALYTDQSNYIKVETQNTISTGTYVWNHLAFTYDGSKLASGIKLFVNKVEAQTDDVSQGNYIGLSNDSNELRIGSGEWGWGDHNRTRAGWFDEAKIWNGVLPKAMIDLDYDNGINNNPIF